MDHALDGRCRMIGQFPLVRNPAMTLNRVGV
jgi:hypothetical protein